MRRVIWTLALSACWATKGDSLDSADGPEASGVHSTDPQTFKMGCTEGQGAECRGSNASPAHMVTLTHGWIIDSTEMPQEEYARLMGSATMSSHEDCGSCPVENLSWHLAAASANARSVEDGLEPFYDCDGVDWDSTCAPRGDPYESAGWRLPTEAEWEASARCGTDLRYAGSNDPDEVGWNNQNSDWRTQPVGQKAPNACGLYDMSGNVAEWVNDWYGAYPSGDVQDPSGPSEGTYRIHRGGSYLEDVSETKVSNRSALWPERMPTYVAFRHLRPLL